MLSRTRPNRPRMPMHSQRLSMLEGLLLTLTLRFSQAAPLPSPCLKTILPEDPPHLEMASPTYPALLLPRQWRLRCSLRQTVECSPVLTRRVTRSQHLLLTSCHGRHFLISNALAGSPGKMVDDSSQGHVFSTVELLEQVEATYWSALCPDANGDTSK